MAANRWHRYTTHTAKGEAEKYVNKLRRTSVWRAYKWFKVRIATKLINKKRYYIVEWYGPSTAL